jgi:hypothetical protein
MCPSHKQRVASAEVERSLRARRRFEVAKVAATAGPRPRDMVAAVYAQLLRLDGWVPTRPTICALANLWPTGPDEARNDPSFYLVDHAGGRSKVRLVEALQTQLENDLQDTPQFTTADLMKRLARSASVFGLTLPGEWALRRIIEDARGGVLGRSGANHGRRAAEVDGVPHETLPYTRPHECWSEDEFVLPLWVGMWHRREKRWVSTMLYVAFVVDYVSRAILAWQLCDPQRRLGAQGEQVFSGFDERDVATVFLKAACPELAPEFLAPFTGFLPEHIRMDGHATHVQWKKTVEGHIPTAIHILSAYRPYRNGVQERCGFTVKQAFDTFFAGTPGHVGTHIPTDRIRQNQHEARVRSASTTERPVRKIEILPEDLPRIEDVDQIILPHLIRHYNFERTHTAHGMTPYDAFMSRRPRRSLLTPSTSLIRTLPVAVVTSNKGSLQLQRDKLVHTFDHRIGGRIVPVGATVKTHVHPTAACLWSIEEHGKLTHIPPLRDAAKQRDPVFIARARAELTGGISERTQRAFNALTEKRFGAARAEETREAAARNIAADAEPQKAPTPDGHAGTVNLIDLIAASSMAPEPANEPWRQSAASDEAVETTAVEPYVLVTVTPPRSAAVPTTKTADAPSAEPDSSASVAPPRKSRSKRSRPHVTPTPPTTPASSFWLTGLASPVLHDAATDDSANVRRTS